MFNVDPDAPPDSTCTAVPDVPSWASLPSTTIISNNILIWCGVKDCWTWTSSEADWRKAPNLSNLLYFYGSLVSVDGSAFLLGGFTTKGGLEEWVSNKIYTTTGETWQLAGQLQQGRWGHCSVVVGRNIITTGGDPAEVAVEIFNTGDGTTTQLSDMNIPRWGHGCTTYNTGGGDEIEIIVAGAYTYDPHVEKMTGTRTGNQGVWQYSGWTHIGSLPDGRRMFPMVNINNYIYILGGELESEEDFSGSEKSEKLIYALATSSVLVSTDGGRTWTEADTALQTARHRHTAVIAGEIC